MIKVPEEKFAVSRILYAVDPESYRLTGMGSCEVRAVWFKRQKRAGQMVTAACAGRMWMYVDPRPRDLADFLDRHTDNRYGADCLARWTGTDLWCNANEATRARFLSFLDPMLAAYPKVPAGYDGWWGFGK